MTWFVSYNDPDRKSVIEIFHDVDFVLGWLREWKERHGTWPDNLRIYKSECCFDFC